MLLFASAGCIFVHYSSDMFSKNSFALLFFIFPFLAFAQTYKEKNYFDLSASVAKGHFTTALSWSHLHGLGKKGRFNVGYGIRFTSVFQGRQDFVTAPAKLTSGVANPTAMFRENILANFDTLHLHKGNVNALNAVIHLQYNLTSKFEAGFNIDALGFSFGKKREGVYTSSIYPEGKTTTQVAKTTPFNVLLISDNDIGSLNSELYVRYWVTPKIAIRAGGTFIFAEYTTNNKLSLDTDRFRNKSWQALLAITFAPFKL
jgi:hypothetical protein